MIQSGHRVGNKNFERIAKDYNTLPVKPTLESEPCYEQHPVEHSFKKGVFKAFHLRQRAYWSLFAGGFGFTYGANGIWQMDKPGKIDKQSHHNFYWYDALHFEGAKQMNFVRKLIESRPFLFPERIPDQSLLLSENDGIEGPVQCSRANDYSFIMAYSTTRSNFKLDLSKFAANELIAWWYNPRDGKLSTAKGNSTNKPFENSVKNEVTEFDPPGIPGKDNDWILIIDDASKSYPPPGTAEIK